MFGKLFKIATVAALIAGASASPLLITGAAARPFHLAARDQGSNGKSPVSFNNWNGISSLSGFDNFYGSNNFGGDVSSVTIIEEDQRLVCRSQSIEIVQQRLLIIQEMARRIITETICEVETQVIVFQQFQSSMGQFDGDLRRKSQKSPGYDKNIASQFGGIMNSDGSLNTSDLGFNGTSNGNNYVVPTGNNWNNQTSPASADAAFNATQSAK